RPPVTGARLRRQVVHPSGAGRGLQRGLRADSRGGGARPADPRPRRRRPPRRRDGRRGEPPDGGSDPRPRAVIERLRSRVGDRDLVVELRLALKMTLGGTLSWWLAVELGAKRPIFAALVPLVAMTGDPFAAVSVSVGRIVGVFIGVGLGVVFVHVAMGSTLRVAIVLLIGTLIAVVFRVGGRPNLEVPIAALFMLGTAIAAVGHLGVQRIWETAIGAVVAVLVASLLWPPDPVRELRRQLQRVRSELVSD